MSDNTSSEESAEDESLLSGSVDYSTEFSEESASETDSEVLPYRFEPVAPVTEAHDGTSGDEDEMGHDLDRLRNTTW